MDKTEKIEKQVEIMADLNISARHCTGCQWFQWGECGDPQREEKSSRGEWCQLEKLAIKAGVDKRIGELMALLDGMGIP